MLDFDSQAAVSGVAAQQAADKVRRPVFGDQFSRDHELCHTTLKALTQSSDL
jgi:hypothetical protein